MSGFLFLASALAVPTITPDAARRIQEYYPQWALQERAQTSASVELTVSPDGRVADCRVVAASGNAQLATDACEATIGLKVTPAMDVQSTPTFGILRTRFDLSLNAPGVKRQESIAAPVDVELRVGRLPNDVAELHLEILLQIAPDGTVTQCEGRQAVSKDIPAAYVAAACGQAKGWRMAVVRDAATGSTVDYVTNVRVRFTRDASVG